MNEQIFFQRYLELMQEQFQWKKDRAAKLDAQDEELIKQNKEMLELMQEMKDICEKQVTQIETYQEMVQRMNKRLDEYGIGFNCGGYHD
jgi:chromosome segregation ATPase